MDEKASRSDKKSIEKQQKRKIKQEEDDVLDACIQSIIIIDKSSDETYEPKENKLKAPESTRYKKLAPDDKQSESFKQDLSIKMNNSGIVSNPCIIKTKKKPCEDTIKPNKSINILNDLFKYARQKYEKNHDDSMKSDQTYVKIEKEDLKKDSESIKISQSKKRLSDKIKKMLYVIKDIKQGEYEIILTMKNVEENKESYGILRDFWRETIININDKVHIMTEKIEYDDENKKWMILDHEEGLLVLYPDFMLSGSVIVDGITCIRKVVLNQYIEEKDKLNPHILNGHLLHTLFQEIIRRHVPYNKEEINVDEMIKNIINDAGLELFCLEKTEEEETSYLKQQFENMKKWLIKYATKMDEGLENDKIEKVSDIEECIWAPSYGLKGNIDATLQLVDKKTEDKIITPLEFKTGREYIIHDGQVLLYLLLLSDCYNQNKKRGLLWYLSQPEMKSIKYEHRHIASLMHIRNTIAVYLKKQPLIMPPMKMDSHICSKCFKKNTCAIIHKSIECGTFETSGMDSWPEEVENMTNETVIFMNKWLRFLDREEYEEKKSQGEIEWSMEGRKREKEGRCISDLKAVSINKKTKEVCFEKISSNEINDENFANTDYVVLSTQNRAGIFKGTITDITKKMIKVIAMDNLSNNIQMEEEVWEMDRMYRASLAPFLRGNIIELVKGNTEISLRLKQLIVNKTLRITYRCGYKDKKMEEIYTECSKDLNMYQKRVIWKIMERDLFTLVNGVPGSGKSTTIAYVTKALVKLGCSVLISSFTNKALDSILKKVDNIGIKFIRIGKKFKIDPLIMPYTIGGDNYPDTSSSALKKLSNEIKVYGCTCHCCDNMLLNNKIFDVCILDEACQTSLPISIGPLLKCKSFALVGDPMQLTPPILSQEYDIDEFPSLFKILAKDYPNDVMMMRYQYRMNDNIMKLANLLVYDNDIYQGMTVLTRLSLDNSKIPLNLVKILDKDVIFMDTDCYGKDLETYCEKYQGYTNYVETAIVHSLISVFSRALIKENTSIGIIAPYNAQVYYLKSKIVDFDNVEISTVDSFQGNDKDIIIISFTRSNKYKALGKLINDWRRINVGLTRAKKKLFMIGSVSSLSYCSFLKSIINLCNVNEWLISDCFVPII